MSGSSGHLRQIEGNRFVARQSPIWPENSSRNARQFLPFAALVPLIGMPSWMLDGIFIGATRSRDMRDMMLVSFVIYAAAALILVPWLGNHGLWVSILISFVARTATLAWRYPKLEAAV